MGEKFVPKGPKRYAHQRRGLMKMIETKGVFALLFDPGTGKTMTTLDYMSILALKAKPDDAGVREVRVLVVAPLAALDTWVMQAEQYVSESVNFWAEAMGGDRLSIRQRAEALAARGGRPFAKQSRTRVKHGLRGIHFEKALMLKYRTDNPSGHPSDGPDVLGLEKPRLVIEIINLDTFSSRQQVGTTSSTTADVVLDAIERFSPELVVVDESHKIKGATSNASRMLARIGRRVPRRGLLTGTVMPAGPLDVYGQWRFLDPYAFGDLTADGTRKTATFDGFRRRYAEMGGYLGHQVIGYKNLDEMQRIMSINAEVARKEDALDLPPTTSVKVPVNLSNAEAKAYADMKKGLATKLTTGLHASAANRLAQMLRLRQITAGHLPDDLGNLNVLGDSKARTISSIVHDQLAGEKRVVVFAYFVHEVDMLKKVLAREGTEIMTISGATPTGDRLALRQRFGDVEKAPGRIVLIAQIRTLNLSVNELVSASHAVFGSLPQTRDDFIQAQDRLNRIGQTRPVTYWFALAPGTIDEVIYNAHETRTNLEASVLRHILGDTEAAMLEAQEARRDEEEHAGQVGRLNDDGHGGVERVYGAQIESVAPPTDEGAA
jgi:SNF2 family DNA or RNA helicase